MSIRRSSDLLLHELTRHANVSVPYSKYVLREIFPEQDSTKLNKEFTLYYKDTTMIASDRELPSKQRPLDDIQRSNVQPDRPEIYEETEIQHGLFKIIRYDLSEPYKFIAVSRDFKHILVGNTQYDMLQQILISTNQYDQYIGLNGKDQYVKDLNEIPSMVFSVNSIEPLYTVLIEYLDDNAYRAVLGDECQTVLDDVYLTKNEASTKNNSSDIKKLIPPQFSHHTINEIVKIRKEILGDRKPYGYENSKG